MLALGRALLQRPRLLMLDEPSLGLAPLIVREIFDGARARQPRGRADVLVVEQDAASRCAPAARPACSRWGTSPSAARASSWPTSPCRKAYLGY